MVKEYHPDTPETRPFKKDNEGFKGHSPPQRHYSPESGEWDGQLPHADIVAPQPNGPEIEVPTWPPILDRMRWARIMIRTHRLPPPQAAVLNEVVYRDGRGNGCSATMETLALETGYNEKSIRTAIQGLEAKNLILSAGGAGQKKLLRLPVQNGELMAPTPVRGSGVKGKGSDQTTVRDSGVESEGRAPTPVTGSWVEAEDSGQTAVRVTGVGLNPGNRFRATPVTGSDITRSKQEERENNIYSSLSLRSSSSTSSPVTGSGVEAEEIERLVEDNWTVLKQFWNHQGGATSTYRRKGLEFTLNDIEGKRQKAEALDLAARTCVHCHTVRDSADAVKPCPRCEDPICVYEGSSCRQNSCFRQQSGNRQQGGPVDWHRR